jgi:hypothetical protein
LGDPSDRFTSETAARRFKKRNGRHVTVSEAKLLQIYNGHVHNGHSPQRTKMSVRV